MTLKTWLKIAAVAGVTGAVGWFAYRQFVKRRSPMRHFNEKEDIDAYNGDDMQPPFEEQTPRQREAT
jgi:hypothetical protein